MCTLAAPLGGGRPGLAPARPGGCGGAQAHLREQPAQPKAGGPAGHWPEGVCPPGRLLQVSQVDVPGCLPRRAPIEDVLLILWGAQVAVGA